MLKPWSCVQIIESGEPLIELPREFLRLEPHPYLSLGAPYGEGASPWFLREDVIKRLSYAQINLQQINSSYQLAIFDAWRPIPVQAFMVDFSIKQECGRQGILPTDQKYQDIVQFVNQFWAPPSHDPSTPPPHSTGGAVDLTIATCGSPLDMGSEIDFMGEESHPNFYTKNLLTNRTPSAEQWNSRRVLLNDAMTKAGFVQHPNEWWHFSFGDQLWAWRSNAENACYGSLNGLASMSFIA